MPRKQSFEIENHFSKGLITDITALQFPKNAATDCDNVNFDFTGRVTRRLGIDVESGYEVIATTDVDEEVYTEFLWEAVAGTPTSFLVSQKGKMIRFFDVTNNTTPSANLHDTSIDLTDYVPATSGKDPAVFECQYATGRGQLIIVNQAIDPIYVVYDVDTADFTTTAIVIKTRDFVGLEDNLALNDRPTFSKAGLKAGNPAHYYNILNQGWGTGAEVALDLWDTARTDMPSKADYISLYRSSATVSFDNARVTAQDPLSTPAPTGHFILTATQPDRTQAMLDQGFTGATVGQTTSLISPSVGVLIQRDYVSNGSAALAFDGVTNTGSGSSATSNTVGTSLLGKDYTASPKRIDHAVVYGSNNQGFVPAVDPAMTITMYASQSLPATATDGIVLGSVSFTDTADEHTGRTITSNDIVTAWNYVWIAIGVGGTHYVAELEFYTIASGARTQINTVERPRATAFYSGRAWYAGIEALDLNNTLFFSQILEKDDQYGKCYQKYDPTSEFLFDLLPNDGGTIVIPEMGRVLNLVSTKNALIIIATNGVWAVSGIAGSYFKANDYQVKQVSAITNSSPQSVALVQGLPLWWGPEGIYTLKFDPSYDAFQIDFLTVGVIDLFLADIPTENKKYVKGVYSPEDYAVFWLYQSEVLGDEKYVYNRSLVYDIRTRAFYPYTFTTDVGTLEIRGITFVQAADRTGTPSVKYVISYDDTDESIKNITFADLNSGVYADWTTYDDEIEDIDGAQDYDSNFITGYTFPGNAMTFAQQNYLIVFCEQQDEDDSCFVQGVYDFATSGNSGRFSNQQIYLSFMEDKSLVYRRLKMRGKGRTLQLRFSSEGDSPFTIIGWSMWVTANASV